MPSNTKEKRKSTSAAGSKIKTGRQQKEKIKVALIGVGNTASVVVQALEGSQRGRLAGVWHAKVGGYSIDDIQLVAAFDIDKNKVGKDLAEAIHTPPNVTPIFAKVKKTGIVVKPGIAEADTPERLRQGDSVTSTNSIVEDLKDSKAEIILNLIPSGMQSTSVRYAIEALKAGCSFVNATPSTIATDQKIALKFGKSKLIVVGDDLMSQFGGTAFHKGILDFVNSRGVKVEKSYQLDVGGGTETLNTISEEVKLAKRDIKSEAIAAEVPYKFQTVAGTTDYVDYMGNNRTSYFWISAKSFFDSDIKIDIYLRTNDGANAANVLFDVVRAVADSKRRRHEYGSPSHICAYGFKKLARPALLRNAHEDFDARYGTR
ncbi:MAG TPA: hypothetical protein VFF30_08635 [Nitrososphaerales archaeon]|nr:hypothetical protein [Nitrososphaerales archaeon]